MLAVGEHVLGAMEPMWVRMSTGVGGGFGACEEACGALGAGVMVIGGAFGRSKPDEDWRPALAGAARYTDRFRAELGHTQCNELGKIIEYWQHDGDQLPRRPVQELTKAAGGVRSCAELVELAAMLILDVLDEVEDLDSLMEWYHAKVQS